MIKESVTIAAKILSIYEALFALYGPQAWWPAESPFEVMVGAILTQNTNWSNVEKALDNLKQKIHLDPKNLLSLTREELETCLKPAGYFRVKTRGLRAYCQWYLAQGGYKALEKLSTLDLRAALLKVHGVGPETADDIVLYAFNRPVFVIDSYTRRLFQRLQIIKGNEDYEDLRTLLERNLPNKVELYKQFHALIVVHAKKSCLKNRPGCTHCGLLKNCFYSVSS